MFLLVCDNQTVCQSVLELLIPDLAFKAINNILDEKKYTWRMESANDLHKKIIETGKFNLILQLNS